MDWHADLAHQIATADPETLKKWNALEQAGAQCAPRLLKDEDKSVLLWRVSLLDLYGEGPSFKEAVKQASRKRQRRAAAVSKAPHDFCIHLGNWQPLSSLGGSGAVVGEGALRNIRPEIFAAGMRFLATWECIDHEWAHVLAAMLDAEWSVVAGDMWETIRSQAPQTLILDRVAERRLSSNESDMMLYKAVQKAIVPVRKRRNDYAHWLWGFCIDRDLRDRLCLVNPRENLLQTASLREQFGPVSPLLPDFSPAEWTWSRSNFVSPEREIRAFRLKDIERDIGAAQEATRLVRLFGLVAARGDKAARARQQLSAELRLPQTSPPQ